MHNKTFYDTNVKHLQMVMSNSYLIQYFDFAHSKQRAKKCFMLIARAETTRHFVCSCDFYVTINQVQPNQRRVR